MPKDKAKIPSKDAKKEDSLFKIIQDQTTSAINDSSAWRDRLERFHRIRFRIKKQKNFPFKKSSNIRMPTADIVIKKIKSGLMGVIFGIRPIVQVEPAPGSSRESALKIEKFLDHLIMDVIEKPKQKCEQGIDASLEKGFSLLQPYWRTEMTTRREKYEVDEAPIDEVMFIFTGNQEALYEAIIAKFSVDMDDRVAEKNLKSIDKALDAIKSGKSVVEFDVTDIVYDAPDIATIDPENFHVPSDARVDPQHLAWGTREFYATHDQVKSYVKTLNWSKSAVDQIEVVKGMSDSELTSAKFTKEQREGISGKNNPSKLIKIYETTGWYDVNGDGIAEKAIVTTLPDYNVEVRRGTLSQLSGKLPIVKLFYELTYDSWYSHRGIPDMLEDIITEIDVQHNMKIDAQTVRNAPMFIYRSGMVNPQNVQMQPNQGIPVNGMQSLDDTLKVLNLNNPNVEFSYEREEQILESKIQEITGQIDFALHSQINKRQPRTLGEVEAQQQNASRNFSNDVDHYTQAFTELFNMIFELWVENGKDEYEFMYFGDTQQGESIKITKEEIQSKFKIKIRGNDQNVNPQVRMQKAQQILQVSTNPLLIQSGIVSPVQMANGVKRFLQELDVENWEDYIIAEPQPQKPQLADRIPPDFSDLSDAEQAQILAEMGIKPDAIGRNRKNALETTEKAANALAKVAG